MKNTKSGFDWVKGGWFFQVLFFLFCGGLYLRLFTNNEPRQTLNFYMGILILFLLLSTLNAFVFPEFLRRFFGTLFLLIFIFLIPLSCDSFGLPIGWTAAAGLVYAVAIMSLAPRTLAFIVLIFSAAFACYLHQDQVILRKVPILETKLGELEQKKVSSPDEIADDSRMTYYTVPRDMDLKTISSLKSVYGDQTKWPFLYEANKHTLLNPEGVISAGTILIVPTLPVPPQSNYLMILLAYLLALLMAYAWRMLIKKMYRLYNAGVRANLEEIEANTRRIENDLEKTNSELRLLKEEMALQIIQMNKITGYKNGK